MTRTLSRPKHIVSQLHRPLPGRSAIAQKIERQKLWERTARDAAEDDATEFDDELVNLIDACARGDACFQIAD